MELLVVFGIAVLVAGLLIYANEKDLNNQDGFSQDFNHLKINAGYTHMDDDCDYFHYKISDISKCYLGNKICHNFCMYDDLNIIYFDDDLDTSDFDDESDISYFDDDWNYSSWDD